MAGMQYLTFIMAEPYLYQQNTGGFSAAAGIESAGVYTISVSGSPGAQPSLTSQLVLDPLGNSTLRSSTKVVLDGFAQITSLSTGFLKSDASGNITVGASPIATVPYTSVNHAASPYTTLAGDYYISADVTAGTVSVLLPNSPATGRVYIVKDKVGLAATSNITVTTVGGVDLIDGSTSYTMNTSYEVAQFVFNGSAWEVF